MNEAIDLSNRLVERFLPEMERASKQVYQIHGPTPTEKVSLSIGDVILKREDQSVIHSYKWRGAFFKMLSEKQNGFLGDYVAASAGNHAQGVAFAAKKLKVNAVVFMPITTPKLKQDAVKDFGGDYVSIRLIGDSYDQASEHAKAFSETYSACFVSPFDDPLVIAGQATVGLELFQQFMDLRKVYVPIGGGGLVAGMILAIEKLRHDCEIVGVEVGRQEAMSRSLSEGRHVCLNQVDSFCDGTAVKRPGELTFQLCRQFLNRIVVVDNQQVAAAIRFGWENNRMMVEPSGAVALAGLLKDCSSGEKTGKIAAIVSGSNVDFKTFSKIAMMSEQKNPCRRYYKFHIKEAGGSLIRLLDRFLQTTNIVDFQYGKTNLSDATPILGLESDKEQLTLLEDQFRLDSGLQWEPVFSSISDFRIIPFRPDLCNEPLFLKTEFPNRSGALRELMREVSEDVNICYFNFSDSGEAIGEVLIGFEALHENGFEKLFQTLTDQRISFRRYQRFGTGDRLPQHGVNAG